MYSYTSAFNYKISNKTAFLKVLPQENLFYQKDTKMKTNLG